MSAHRGVANLDERAQNMQLRFGLCAMALGLVAAMAMNALGVGRGVHALLLPVLFVGAYGVCAGLCRTCGVTAMAGRRLTASGSEPIADRCELAALRRRGLAVVVGSLVVSALATALLSMLSR